MDEVTDGNDKQLTRYGIIMSYLGYENSIYWGRSNFFLIGNTALVGFVSTKLPLINPDASIELVIATLIMSVAGGFLTDFWRRSLNAGEFWIDHWHDLLQQLEPDAFPEHQVLREFRPRPNAPHKVRARVLARNAVYLFFVLWALLFAVSVVALVFVVCR